MYYSYPHPHRLQLHQHIEQEASTLESFRINLKHEQRNKIHRPNPQPPSKARNGRGRTLSSQQKGR